MLSQKVQKYIKDHSFCSECLFKDWESFLNLLYAEGDQISSIFGWGYCKVLEQSFFVRGGGYRDPENPEYMYAETQRWKNDLETMTPDKMKAYITRERKTGFQYGSKYISHDLVRSFYFDK
ncbi:hypothetical protein [Coprobacter fastidiosus]|uniref:hypothetical protein n=1 Tax=Coprobacter fastidiosus TaxID=1099853 RepID=UPI003AB8EC22